MFDLIIGGCSGSYTPAHPRPKFGHLTTSYGLLDRENRCGIVIDNGSGVQVVSQEMLNAGVVNVTILQTHFHSDHMEGLQMNKLLFNKNIGIEFFVPGFMGVKSFEQIYAERFDPTAWPISPAMLGCHHSITVFDPYKSNVFRLGENVYFVTLKLNHPGGSVGYKIYTPGKTVVIATDNELGFPGDSVEGDEFLSRYAAFLECADILIADVQYIQGEYDGNIVLGGMKMSRKGWGHSTPQMMAMTLWKCLTPPKIIYFTHHDPARTDEDLAEFSEYAQKVDPNFRILSTTP